MPALIYISEIHPNPETGSEWIELSTSEPMDNNLNLANYSIFDSYHQIHKFTNEQFSNRLLVVELSGLNNDQDSVILKNENGEIIDSFKYTTTQKGLSFARDEMSDTFTIEVASKNQVNPSESPTPSLEPSPTITPTSSPTTVKASPTPSEKPISLEPSISITNTSAIVDTNQTKTTNQNIKTKYHDYDLNQIKLKTEDKSFTERLTRLVFLGKNQGQAEIINAIIGSSLIILSSLFLIYAKFKKKRN